MFYISTSGMTIKVEKKSVKQLKEEKEHDREVEARKLADALNVDYFE